MEKTYPNTAEYGYFVNKDGYLEIDGAQMPVVKEIFNRYDKGEMITNIVDSLNDRGFRCSTGTANKVKAINDSMS